MADVAVVGCGRMGSAIARRFAEAGHPVVVWNRSAERAKALVGGGITRVDTADEAFRRASLVVTCMLNCSATLSVLQTVRTADQSTVINLASGTPDEATLLAAWAAEQRCDFLDGMPVGYPRDIGSPAGMLIYSGPGAVWHRNKKTLGCLGGASWHVAEDVTAVNVLTIGLGSFYAMAQVAEVLRDPSRFLAAAAQAAPGWSVRYGGPEGVAQLTGAPHGHLAELTKSNAELRGATVLYLRIHRKLPLLTIAGLLGVTKGAVNHVIRRAEVDSARGSGTFAQLESPAAWDS